VVAEGVETPDHLQRAREACCDAVQGYHLSRPLDVSVVGRFLTTWAGMDARPDDDPGVPVAGAAAGLARP
jgi:EAL domain-containing protein (putative c-di-GMP-specific phosphodiesterase class I)